MFRKRIGNDIAFVWRVYRKDRDTGTVEPEDFEGKDVTVKLISPLQRAVEIENITISTGVVKFSFKGKNQHVRGTYTAVLQENKGADGMVTLDVVDAVTLVPHSYMEEDGDEGDVIEAASVELTSSISAGGGGVDAYTKEESDGRFVHYGINRKGISFLGDEGSLDYTVIQPNGVRVGRSNTDGTSHSRFIDITADNIEMTSTRRDDPDESVTRKTTVVWHDELDKALAGKQDKMSIVQVASSTTLSAVVGNYYRLDNVGTLAITLPTITGATQLQAIKFLLVCGSSALVTFVPQGSETILYQEDFVLEADTTYEVTALWNGSEWTLSRVIYG